MTQDERVDELVESMSGGLDKLAGAERELTRDMLRSYCWFAVQVYDLTKLVDEQGALIEVEKGGADNRRIVMAENPAIGTIHKLSARKAEYYTKLLRVLPDEASKTDAMAEFLGR